jgi:hypothetical protein
MSCQTVLTRRNTITGIEYRNDPTIFAWELINEPRCMSDASGDTLQVSCDSWFCCPIPTKERCMPSNTDYWNVFKIAKLVQFRHLNQIQQEIMSIVVYLIQVFFPLLFLRIYKKYRLNLCVKVCVSEGGGILLPIIDTFFSMD